MDLYKLFGIKRKADPLADMTAQRDALLKTLKRLTFAARTSGGVAGRDEYLCSACQEAENLIQRNAESVPEGLVQE